jgi:hypothetical protein
MTAHLSRLLATTDSSAVAFLVCAVFLAAVLVAAMVRPGVARSWVAALLRGAP